MSIEGVDELAELCLITFGPHDCICVRRAGHEGAHATAPERITLAPAHPTGPSEPDWKARYEQESDIVDRCWTALGVAGYDNGPPIWERISALRKAQPSDDAQREAFVAGFNWCRNHCDQEGYPHDTPEEAYTRWLASRGAQET